MSRSHPMMKQRLLLFLFLLFSVQRVYGLERIPIRVQRHRVGAPLTLGVPFPLGALNSPDRVRVVGPDGREILSQVTEVSTWEPADESIKWVWVFLIAESSEEYFIEYGEDVSRELNPSPRIDGYAEIYVSQSLPKYFQLTGDERVRKALIRNARRIRDVPPRDHALESYLGSINGLLVGYELSGERCFLEEAVRRAEMMKTRRLPEPPPGGWTRETLYRALNELDPLPKETPMPTPSGLSRMPVNWSLTHGLRIFGWTHAFALPQLLYWLAN